MSSGLRVVILDFAELEAAFRTHDTTIVDQLDDDHWNSLFCFPMEEQGEASAEDEDGETSENEEEEGEGDEAAEHEDDEDWERELDEAYFADDAYDVEAVEQMRGQLRQLLGGDGVTSEPSWEDALFGLCVHFGEELGNEFFDRVNVDWFVEIETSFRRRVKLNKQWLQTLVYSSPLPLALPPASDGVHFGFISAARVTELDEALSEKSLDFGDPYVTGAAVQLRYWLRLAATYEHAIVLYYS